MICTRWLRIRKSPDEPAARPQLDANRLVPVQRDVLHGHGCGICRLIADQQRLIRAATQEGQRDLERSRCWSIRDHEEPAPAAPARERRDLTDLTEGQHTR